MSPRKPGNVKHGVKSTAAYKTSAYKRVQKILNSEMIHAEYQEALMFAIWLNTRRCRRNGEVLTDNVLKTVEKASKEYVLAGQAQQLSPKDIKRKMMISNQRSRNRTTWTSNTVSEEQHSLMAGAKRRVKS